MTVSELKKQLEVIENLGLGNLKVLGEGEYGFGWETKEVVLFDDKVVIEREE